MKFSSKLLLSVAAAASLGALSTGASAETRWARHHPRQHEVLKRDRHLISRINTERREGELTRGQASADRAAVRSVAREDHADARANGGYITKGEQRALNAQENADSKTIGK